MRHQGPRIVIGLIGILGFVGLVALAFQSGFQAERALPGDIAGKVAETVVPDAGKKSRKGGPGLPDFPVGAGEAGSQRGGPKTPVRSAFDASSPAVSTAVREGRFAEAVRAVDKDLRAITDPEARAAFERWKAVLKRLAGLPGRMGKGLTALSGGLPCAKLGVEPREGTVTAVVDAGIEISVRKAVVTQPWKALPWTAWQALVSATCGAEAATDLALLALERDAGEAEAAGLADSEWAAHAAVRRAPTATAKASSASTGAGSTPPGSSGESTKPTSSDAPGPGKTGPAPTGTATAGGGPRPHAGPAGSFGAKHYVNAEYGFAFLPPSGWEGIPAPKEVNEQFRGADRFRVIVRYQRRTGAAELLDVIRIDDAPNLDAAVALYRKEPSLGHEAPFTLKPARLGGQPGATFFHSGRNGSGVTVGLTAAYGEAYALRFVAASDKPDKDFLESIKTFVFLNDDQRAKLARSGRTGELPPGWKAFRTAHYEIQHDCEDDFARELGRHLEAILTEYRRRFPMDFDEAAGDRFTVKAFRKQEAFESYASANGVTGAAAYFSPSQNELVCYKTVDQGRRKTFHILYHEASHQYLHLYMGGDVDIPIWLNEGVAEYFYGGEFTSDGKFRIEENKDRILDIKEAIRQNRHVPLAKLFAYTQAQYYADAQLCYAEGWSLAYFLWHTKDPRFAGRIDGFYEVLRRTKDKHAAFAETFGKVDLPMMEEAWKKFVLGL